MHHSVAQQNQVGVESSGRVFQRQSIMKPPPPPPSLGGGVLTSSSLLTLLPINNLTRTRVFFSLNLTTLRSSSSKRRRLRFFIACSAHNSEAKPASSSLTSDVISPANESLNIEVRSPLIPPNFISAPKFSLTDQAFFLFAFIACTTSVAFTSLVVATVPTLFAMRRAAISLSKLADTAREELPSTMAAIRLSGMEISDLTLELTDLSQEIADGVNKSAQAVQAAEAGIRQIGSLARQQTMSMIQERASLPIISLQPVVAGAAKKTSHAVGQATKSFLNIISRREGEDDDPVERIES